LPCKREIDHLIYLAEQVVDGDDTVIQITTVERLLRFAMLGRQLEERVGKGYLSEKKGG
jgi:hypothetical protein